MLCYHVPSDTACNQIQKHFASNTWSLFDAISGLCFRKADSNLFNTFQTSCKPSRRAGLFIWVLALHHFNFNLWHLFWLWYKTPTASRASQLLLWVESRWVVRCRLSSRELRKDGGFTQLSTGIEVTVGCERRGSSRAAAGIRGLTHSLLLLPPCTGSGLSSTGDLARPTGTEYNALPFSHSSLKP